MADERTERQRKADDALDGAIREAQAAYAEHDAPEFTLVAEWVVVGRAVGDDPDDYADRTFVFSPDGGHRTPLSHTIGLLRTGTLLAEDEFGHGDED